MRVIGGVALQILAEASREQLGEGATGARECPICGGWIRWRVGKRTRRGLNVSGACETPDCVSFLT